MHVIVQWDTSSVCRRIDLNVIVQVFPRYGICNTMDGSQNRLIRDYVPKGIKIDDENDDNTADPDDDINLLDFSDCD